VSDPHRAEGRETMSKLNDLIARLRAKLKM
jgi:hypothetical protein